MKRPQDPNQATSDEDILAVARERFDLAVEAEAPIRALAVEDMKFAAGEQWPSDVEQVRSQDGRPCLTINRIPQFIRQITNDQKQNRPSIRVSPVDDKADIETAKIYQGIIRHIEYASDADIAYDTAFDRAVRGGFGYFRIVTEYCDPYSFDQDIRIKRIRNPFTVYLDPSYQQPDASDANWGFIFEDLTKDEYLAQYPKSEMASMDDWESIGDQKSGWASKNSVRVAEYFCKEYEEKTLVRLVNGEVHLKDELPAEAAYYIESERKSLVPVVKWYKLNGVEILEKTDWPGRWIPIIPVLGEELDIEGKRILEGVVRHAKDPQRMYNYWASSETETIALAPRAPFIGYAGQFEGFEDQWATANRRNHAFLQVKPTMVGGQPAPLPQRNSFEPPVQAITQARMMASDDLKATTGIYDGALGARSNETSGVAIRSRNAQAQTSNFHFMDNLTKSIRHCGRQLVDLIPKIYDTNRAVRILGEDGTEEVVRINQEFQRKGKAVTYNLGVGKYDVTVATGPGFETKRQEAVQAMLEFTRSMPQSGAAVADLMVKNMDWPGAAEIAERLRKMLPPNLQDDQGKQPLPPEAQAQMAQMGQLIDQLTQKLNEANQKIETKSIELESRERIEMAKLQAQVEMKLAEMGSQEAMMLLKQEVAEIQERINLLRFDQPFEIENGAGPEMGQPPMEPMNQMPTDGLQTSGQPMEF